MRSGALHVSHKDQDVHDAQNRVIGNCVVAVSTDTGDVRFGNGVAKWRDLSSFGGGGDKADSSVEGYDGEGYHGPLHVVVFTEDEITNASSESELMEFVPAANEMVAYGNRNLYFGDGERSLNYLRGVVSGNQDS